MKTDKLEDLAGWISLLRSSVVDAERKDEAKKEASKIARELFPPMAKALVWGVEDGSAPNHPAGTNDICSQWIGGHWYRIRSFPSVCPSDDLLISCALCVGESANLLQWCMTIEEAKAWCEAHHQARFLEQLA